MKHEMNPLKVSEEEYKRFPLLTKNEMIRLKIEAYVLAISGFCLICSLIGKCF